MANWFGESKRGRLGTFFGNRPTVLAYWQLNGSSIDNSGNGNAGSDSALVYGAKPVFLGKSPFFTHANTSGITLPSSIVSGANPWTIFFWFNIAFHSATYSQTIISLGSSANTSPPTQVGIGFQSQYNFGQISANFWGGGGGAAVTNIKAGVRHLGCVTYNGSNLAIYIDGVLGAVGGSITANISGSGLSGIGTDVLYSDQFDGSIEEVMIISEVITQPVVGQYYAWATKKKRGFWENSSWSLLNFLRTLSDSMMNADSRLATVTGKITFYIGALSVSMMNAVSRLVTLFAQPSIYFRNLSVSMMNSVSRTVVLTTGNMKIIIVNMMNAAGRYTTLFSQQMLFIRNITVSMMNAAGRFARFIASFPGSWQFRTKHIASWIMRNKNTTTWTFRNKDPLGGNNIPSD